MLNYTHDSFAGSEVHGTFDVCLAWNWEYDVQLVTVFEAACRAHGLSLLTVTPDTLDVTASSLREGRLAFRALWDRASDADASFGVLVDWARRHASVRINPYELAQRAWDKSAMHSALVHKVATPTTIILPAYRDQPTLPPIDLGMLGGCFCIKPARRGGGEGVIVQANELSHVITARREYPNDCYLLQAHVTPVRISGRPAWFRVIYCAGEMFPCWWDMQTHQYTSLRSTVASIAEVCQLHLFSSEIACTDQDTFVVVDYVNDPVDLRLQSHTPDGVPDAIVNAVAYHLAWFIRKHTDSRQISSS